MERTSSDNIVPEIKKYWRQSNGSIFPVVFSLSSYEGREKEGPNCTLQDIQNIVDSFFFYVGKVCNIARHPISLIMHLRKPVFAPSLLRHRASLLMEVRLLRFFHHRISL